MNLKDFVKKNRVGIIALAFTLFNLLLLVDYYFVGTVIGIGMMITVGFGTVRKRNWAIQWLKINILCLLFYSFMNPAPQFWVSQFERRWGNNRCSLIEPTHPYMVELNTSFQTYFLEQNGFEFTTDNNFTHQVRSVDVYVRTIIVNYTFDQEIRDGVYDYLPTIDEIVATRDSHGQLHEDCDGITLLTASFLMYLGFPHVYISEMSYHYHTIVFQEGQDPKTEVGYLAGISLYPAGMVEGNDKWSYYLFNQTELFIPPTRPLVQSLGEILIDGSVWKYDMDDLMSGYYTNAGFGVNLIVVLGISMILGFGMIGYQIGWMRTSLSKNLTPKRVGLWGCVFGIMIFTMMLVNYYLGKYAMTSMVDPMDLAHDVTIISNPLMMLTFMGIFWKADKILFSKNL